jgi:hypothetical protein
MADQDLICGFVPSHRIEMLESDSVETTAIRDSSVGEGKNIVKQNSILHGEFDKPVRHIPSANFSPSCSIVIRKVQKSMEVKVRTAVACFACKSRKKKCDNLRPCSRCVRLGRAALCTSWKEGNHVIEYPIVFNSNSLERLNAEQALAPFVSRHPAMMQAILTLNSCGLRVDSVAHIFNSIPSALMLSAVNLLCKPITTTAAIPRIDAAPTYLSQKSASPSDDERPQIFTDSDRWETDSVFGYFELVYEPGNATRYRCVGMNSRYAELHGYHKEELLARYAAGEAELQRIELDALMFFFYSFKCVLGGGGDRPREFYSRIYVGSGDAKEPLLVWVTMGNSVSPGGQTKVIDSKHPPSIQRDHVCVYRCM